ncbi:MAG: hypothetical protein L3J78_03125 [Thermoplasmata archaeon]|nr:hypothetical protein [Thermoplasmata archaeon]
MEPTSVLRGLLAGLAATGAMTLVELAARSVWGPEGLLDWRVNQATAARLLRRPAEDPVRIGLGFHFLHGLILGLILALILPCFARWVPIPLLGLGYGAALFGVTLCLHEPIAGEGFRTRRFGPAVLAMNLLSHLVYGAAL